MPLTHFMSDCPFKSGIIPGGWGIASSLEMSTLNRAPCVHSVCPAATSMTDYDSATAFLGEWGRFQKQVFYLLCLRAIPCGYTALSVVFLAGTPQHRCLVPAQTNLTPVWGNSSIPLVEPSGLRAPERSHCSRYRLTDVQRYSERGLLPADVNWSTVATEGCLDGWQYDQSIYASTVVSEVGESALTCVHLQQVRFKHCEDSY